MMFELDARRTALVLIDLQVGIVSLPIAPYDAAKVLANGEALGRRCNEVGATTVLVNVGFASNLVDRLQQPVDVPPSPPVSSDFVPPIAALAAEITITKRQWGAFHGTELDLQLRRRGITTIVLGGIATNFGVESTAREAWQHGYAVVIAEDACSSFSDEMHQFAVTKILPRIARVRPTTEILVALR